ncbi:glycine cleavage system protein GcvH [Streptomyces sannanensis]|uniref:Glycine cleavage system H protein n=1 Tax=Streptomyces sannanensis TaxID=285536 RepID=A0ABP6SCW5_9ACTN
MTHTPEDRRYSKDHEWVRTASDTAKVGLTDHAQRRLGDIVFVELPKAGDRFEAGEPFGSVESVKAVSEVCMPVTGTVTAVNEGLDESPESVNGDPYDDGWLIEIRADDPAQINSLLSAGQYEEYIREEAAE